MPFLTIFVADLRIFYFLSKPLPYVGSKGHVYYLFFQQDKDLEGQGSPDPH